MFLTFLCCREDPTTALIEPNSIVIPEDVARKYFGDEDPLGKTLLLGKEKAPHTVTAVLEKLPDNSHFHFSMLRAMSTLEYSRDDGWFNNSFQTYLLLHEGASAEFAGGEITGAGREIRGTGDPAIPGGLLRGFCPAGQ